MRLIQFRRVAVGMAQGFGLQVKVAGVSTSTADLEFIE